MSQHNLRETYIKKALEAIDEYKLFFVTDVAPMIGISVSRFYQLELEKVEAIKNALVRNKVEIKGTLRNKWYKSDAPALQMGLYKLVADEDEYHRLANTKMDITTREEQPIFQGISHKLNKDDSEENKDEKG